MHKSHVPFIMSLDYKLLSDVFAVSTHKAFFFFLSIPHIHWVLSQVGLWQLSVHFSTKAYFGTTSLRTGWWNFSSLKSIPIDAEGSSSNSWDEKRKKSLWLIFGCGWFWFCFFQCPHPFPAGRVNHLILAGFSSLTCMCNVLWTARVLDWQKPFPHSWHLKGFSLEWMYLQGEHNSDAC